MTEQRSFPCSIVPVRDFPSKEDRREAVVLRYLTIQKLVSLFKLKAIWFSRLGGLQDKFEATLPSKARDRLLERDRKYAAQLACYPKLLPLIQSLTDKGVDNGRKGFAVNCWFLGKQESEIMWNEYGEQGKGVAIQSTVERLSTSFQLLGGFTKVSLIGRVQYVDFDSHDMEEGDAARIDSTAFLKEIGRHAHEQEVRILTPNVLHAGCLSPDGSPPTNDQLSRNPFDPDRKGLYVRCQLQTLIHTVIVGPRADPNLFECTKQLVNEYGLPADVQKSKLIVLPR
jgi:hypothetical protein